MSLETVVAVVMLLIGLAFGICSCIRTYKEGINLSTRTWIHFTACISFTFGAIYLFSIIRNTEAYHVVNM